MNGSLQLRNRAHGVASGVPTGSGGALECMAVGVCTAVYGAVPLAGRRAHLGFRSKCIVSTTYMPHGALDAQPQRLLF
jgi:hypothetical protein